MTCSFYLCLHIKETVIGAHGSGPPVQRTVLHLLCFWGGSEILMPHVVQAASYGRDGCKGDVNRIFYVAKMSEGPRRDLTQGNASLS